MLFVPEKNTSAEFTIDQNVQIEITIVEPVAESQRIRMNTFRPVSLSLPPLWKPCRIINDIVVLVSLIRVSFYYTVRFTDLLIDECRTPWSPAAPARAVAMMKLFTLSVIFFSFTLIV